MKATVRDVKKCRICGSSKLAKFLDLGSMPIPNGYLNKKDLKGHEPKFELACFFCQECCLAQLTKVVNPNFMFRNYAYVSAMSGVMMNNFSNLSFEVFKNKN